MKVFLSLCLLTLLATTGYCDGGSDSPQAQAMKAQMEKLVELDRKIEGLEKQKLQYKAEAAQDLERGSFGILPREGRRAARQASEAMQNVQEINQQIEQLNQERQNVMMALK